MTQPATVTLPIQCEAPSNSTQKLMRPGFGPALKRLVNSQE
jgi:hypothetical protein